MDKNDLKYKVFHVGKYDAKYWFEPLIRIRMTLNTDKIERTYD